jgi:pentatricopeptide repeat protein
MREAKELGEGVLQTTYHSLFAAFAKKGETEKSRELLREMRGQGVRPSLATYTQVVRAFASKLEKEECEKVLREMAQDGVKPDRVIHVMMGDMEKRIMEREKGEGEESKTKRNEESEDEWTAKPIESAWVDVLMKCENESKENVNGALAR